MDYLPQPRQLQRLSVTGTNDTFFSAWTPISNKTSNQQLFEERVTLVLHWFDLWTDRQRKLFLHALLSRSSGSQLRSCRDWLKQTVPVTNLDFTSMLPRFLSLYVMSFLTPRDLCSAAQVSWHWRVLAEQDCLWSLRCVRRGWFLPYSPGDKEYGGWKSHYISCVSTLDWLTPREAAQTYGTLNMPCPGEEEEEQERRTDRRIRQSIRARLEEQKKTLLRSRPAWRSPGGTLVSCTQGVKPVPWGQRKVNPTASWLPDRTGPLSSSWDHLTPDLSLNLTLEKTHLSGHVRPKAMGTSHKRIAHQHSAQPAPLLLLSNRIPAYELVLGGVRPGVVVVLYDQRGTLQALLSQAESALGGRKAERLGLLAPGGTEEINLLHGCKVTERSVRSPDVREFWEKLCGWVVPTEEGGGVDIFCPLAASARGVLLGQCLCTLTGLEVSAPTGMATGSFQNLLGEWSCCGRSNAACVGIGALRVCPSPTPRYVCEGVFQGWAWQAQWLEGALGALRSHLGQQLPRLSLESKGRALGQFLWEALALEQLAVSKDVTVALTEGLIAVTTQQATRPLEFLSLFLKRWGDGEKEVNEEEETGGEEGPERSPATVFLREQIHGPIPEEWRGVLARELYISECVHVKRLEAVKRCYHDPLLSALQSNRAIISSAHIDMILTPVTHILDIHKVFLSELGSRLQHWEADMCVGDVCVKFCSKLRLYTNYLNNYPTAIRTIDKCREMNPAFRALLKRHDRTLDTHMLSLQELLLCPVWRVQEYVTLLKALSLHTPSQHPDHTQLSGALDTLTRYEDVVYKLKGNLEKDLRMQETQRMIRGCPLKGNLEKDLRMQETQRMIRGCPNLSEGSRWLITNQDAALLKCPSEDITAPLRIYEHVSDVGLFLFNDALVLTEMRVCHQPFTLSHCHTHTFLASISLNSLTLREITDTRYVCNGFVLEAPSRSWTCAIDRQDSKERFLCSLRSAIHTSITET
ncbi:hypothetical protein UPYG_G00227020 [Umbra pygmaea]|uniref:DH domain-containing protein n=1 Tax=Umbra pygmaea TaxID=75934 RepID=A0ABD0WEB2_UMBPY